MDVFRMLPFNIELWQNLGENMAKGTKPCHLSNGYFLFMYTY